MPAAPGSAVRLFTPAERGLPVASLAARFAAKEAVAKALGAPAGLVWHDCEVVTADSGRPHLLLRGTVAAAADGAGRESLAGVAVARRGHRVGRGRRRGRVLMRTAHSVDVVRAAEASVLAAAAAGALMARASAGLAATCTRLLGQVYGARVVLLVGTGDNGGDALFAGARLAGRGARVDALLVGDRAHAAGTAALLAAGGRVTTVPTGWSLEGAVEACRDHPVGRVAGARAGRSPPTWCVDGVLGIGGRGALREPAAALAAAAGSGGAPGWWPSTCPAGSTPTPGRSRVRPSAPT